jgi:hypothetical protein
MAGPLVAADVALDERPPPPPSPTRPKSDPINHPRFLRIESIRISTPPPIRPIRIIGLLNIELAAAAAVAAGVVAAGFAGVPVSAGTMAEATGAAEVKKDPNWESNDGLAADVPFAEESTGAVAPAAVGFTPALVSKGEEKPAM